jgi:hypothetical protein
MADQQGRKMKLIEQDMNEEDDLGRISLLVDDLKSWHNDHPFQNGIDWARQVYWAKMTEEDFLLFVIKHPNYQTRFRTV